MERLKNIQEYVQSIKNEIYEIKNMENEKLVAEGKSVQLDLELVALMVKSGIPEKGTKVTINSDGTKEVEFSDYMYHKEIDELIADENIEKFIEVANKVHDVFLCGKEKKQGIVDEKNREVIESILNTMHSVIHDINLTIEKQEYDINMIKEKAILYKVNDEYDYISSAYNEAKKDELEFLVKKAIILKDSVFSFAMDLVDKVVV